MTNETNQLVAEIEKEVASAKAAISKFEGMIAEIKLVAARSAHVDDVTIKARTIICGDYRIYVPAFSLSTYNCSVEKDGKAYTSATDKPAVSMKFSEMRDACKKAGGDLMRGSQHLALAMDIMSVDANWSGGAVGQGILKRGLHRGTVSGAQPGTYVSPHADEDRWFLLPDGQRICDAAGHLWGAMLDDIHGTPDGLAGNIPADSPYLVIAKEYTMAQGIGYRPTGACNWPGDALIRGGRWWGEDYAGVFSLGGTYPVGRIDSVGFRSTKSLG